MFEPSQLLKQVGNQAEQRRLLIHVLELERGQEDYPLIALVLTSLSDKNLLSRLYKEASDIYELLGDTVN